MSAIFVRSPVRDTVNAIFFLRYPLCFTASGLFWSISSILSYRLQSLNSVTPILFFKLCFYLISYLCHPYIFSLGSLWLFFPLLLLPLSALASYSLPSTSNHCIFLNISSIENFPNQSLIFSFLNLSHFFLPSILWFYQRKWMVLYALGCKSNADFKKSSKWQHCARSIYYLL